MDIQIKDLTFEPYITEESIHSRIEEITAQLRTKFKNETPVFLCMLNGAFVFMADLVRSYQNPCLISFVKYHSYEGMESTGELTEVMGIQDKIEGRPIIFVEDIIDSGITLERFIPVLKSHNPKSVTIVSLLTKPEAMEFNHRIDYVGFEIGNAFVVGYGLDYDGEGRQLKEIYKLKKIG